MFRLARISPTRLEATHYFHNRGSMKPLLACIAVIAFSSNLSIAQPAPKSIEKLQWMVGTWEAEEGTSSDKESVRLNASLAPSGTAIQYHVDIVHANAVTPRYDGMFYWIASSKTYVIRQVSITGGVVEGEYKQDGTQASQEETVFNPDGTKSFIKAEYTISPGQFRFQAQFKASESAAWIPAIDVTYRKVDSGSKNQR
jgi:hypothetical protein